MLFKVLPKRLYRKTTIPGLGFGEALGEEASSVRVAQYTQYYT